MYFQIVSSDYETEGSVRIRIFTEVPGQAVREAYYLLRGSRWTRIGNPPVDVEGTELVDVTLQLLDSEELWSVPEEG